MLNALLAPFSHSHWRAHVNDKYDAFYEQVTKESLRERFRKDLLDYRRGDDFIQSLRLALSGTDNDVRKLFEQYARVDDQTQQKVWTYCDFAVFLQGRLGDHDHGLNNILWRCFCYNATYPLLTDLLNDKIKHLDQAAWTQAVGLLAGNADLNLGRNSAAGLLLYSLRANPEQRKDADWRRFVSLAGTPNAPINVGAGRFQKPHAQILDEITAVARTQLPSSGRIRPPLPKAVKQRLEEIEVAADGKAMDFILAISYHDMLALVKAVLQVDKRDSEDGYSYTARFAQQEDQNMVEAIAASILATCGIVKDEQVLFSSFHGFNEYMRHQDEYWHFSFEDEMAALWKSLFNPSREESSPDGLPLLATKAVRFLMPIMREKHFNIRRQQCTLATTIKLHSSSSAIASATLLKAMTSGCHQKIMVLTGTVPNPEAEGARARRNGRPPSAWDLCTPAIPETKPAMLILQVSSPLWLNIGSDSVRKFYFTDEHIILQAAPEARALWWDDDSMVDTVDMFVRWSDKQMSLAVDVKQTSHFSINFKRREAVLSSEGEQVGYKEILVGPRGDTQCVEDSPEHPLPFTTIVKLDKIEVYNMPGGVDEDLILREDEAVEDEGSPDRRKRQRTS